MVNREIQWPTIKEYNLLTQWHVQSKKFFMQEVYSLSDGIQRLKAQTLIYLINRDDSSGYMYRARARWPFMILELNSKILHLVVLIFVMLGNLIGLTCMALLEMVGFFVQSGAYVANINSVNAIKIRQQCMMRLLSILVKPVQWVGLLTGYTMQIVFPRSGMKLITSVELAAYRGPFMARIASQFPLTDLTTGLPIVSELTSKDLPACHEQPSQLSCMLLNREQYPEYKRKIWHIDNENQKTKAYQGAEAMSDGAIVYVR